MNGVVSGSRYEWLSRLRFLVYVAIGSIVIDASLGYLILSEGPFSRPSWIVWQAWIHVALGLTMLGAALAGRRRMFVLSVLASSTFWAFVVWHLVRSFTVLASLVVGVPLLGLTVGATIYISSSALLETEAEAKALRVLFWLALVSVVLDVLQIALYVAPNDFAHHSHAMGRMGPTLQGSYALVTTLFGLAILVSALKRHFRSLVATLFVACIIRAFVSAFFVARAYQQQRDRWEWIAEQHIPGSWRVMVPGSRQLAGWAFAAYDVVIVGFAVATLVYLLRVHLRVRETGR